jgi:hypothetical protein
VRSDDGERVGFGVMRRFDYHRGMRFRLHLAAAVACWAACAFFAACKADVETRCVGGDQTCDPQTFGPAASSSTGGGVCLAECDIENASGQTGQFPCAIEAIMEICRDCHTDGTPLQPGAPFPLDTYEQSQELYAGQTRYFRMKNVVEIDFMPLGGPPLTDEQKTALIDDWICNCAPPRQPGDVCN